MNAAEVDLSVLELAEDPRVSIEGRSSSCWCHPAGFNQAAGTVLDVWCL